jgi:hypothetical protein
VVRHHFATLNIGSRYGRQSQLRARTNHALISGPGSTTETTKKTTAKTINNAAEVPKPTSIVTITANAVQMTAPMSVINGVLSGIRIDV